MKSVLQKITAFFLSIFAGFFGLFGVELPEIYPENEPPQVQEEIEEQGEWLLQGVPSFDAGFYSSALYNAGTGLFDDTADRTPETDFEEGDLSQSATSAATMMQLVRKTTLADAVGYGEKLKSLGYTQTYSHQIENNFYYAYETGGSSVYYYFNGNSGETRILDDHGSTASLQTFSSVTDLPPEEPVTEPVTEPAGDPTQEPDGEIPTQEPEETPDTPAAEPQRPTVYQFSYPYRDAEHVGKDNYGSNGMLYAVALTDGRLIVIDGGNRWQASEQNVTEFFSFLHTVSGTPEGEKLHIALWYCTHSHGDHTAFFYKLLRRYSDRIDLQRAMFNFPADSVMVKNAYATRIRSILATRYPALQYLKTHSGMSFQVQDAFCEVLYTHEDYVNIKDATIPADNLNEGCSVLRMTIGNTVFLFPGDALEATAATLLNNFSATTLHADVLQASHHLLVNLPGLYAVVAPTYVMCPASRLRATTTPYEAYLNLRQTIPDENFFFAGDGFSYGFTPQADGTIALCGIETNCGAYAGSTLH